MAFRHVGYTHLLEHVPTVIANVITEFLASLLLYESGNTDDRSIYLYDEVWTCVNVHIHRLPNYQYETINGHYIITWRTRHYTSEYWVHNLHTGMYTTYVIDEYTCNPSMVDNTLYVIADLAGPRSLYNTETEESTLIPDFPICYEIITVVINHKIYIIPDCEMDEHIGIYQYDTRSVEWTQLKLESDHVITAFALTNTLCVIAYDRYADDAHIYMHTNNKWECMATGDFFACKFVSVVDDVIYLFEQHENRGVSLYTINTSTWELGETIPLPTTKISAMTTFH